MAAGFELRGTRLMRPRGHQDNLQQGDITGKQGDDEDSSDPSGGRLRDTVLKIPHSEKALERVINLDTAATKERGWHGGLRPLMPNASQIFTNARTTRHLALCLELHSSGQTQ